MNNKKNMTIFYGLIMATYSMGFVAMSAFSSVYLLDAGMSNGAIGIMLALASLIAVMLEPVAGIIIDRNSKIATREIVLILGILIALIGVVIAIFPMMNLVIKTLVYGGGIVFLMLAQPLYNSLAMETMSMGYQFNFGIGRGMGSLGYAFASLVFGRISVIFGPKSVPQAFAFCFFILSILIYIYPVKGSLIVKKIQADKAHVSVAEAFMFLAKYKKLAGVIIGLVFIYFSHCLINTFALQIVVPKGGTSADMGTASFIAACCEIVTTVLFVQIMKRVDLKLLIKISGIFFALKAFFSLIAPSVTAFFWVQGFQFFGWGILAIGIVYYVNEITSDEDKAQGQAYAGMAMTIGSVLATFIGGNIIDFMGVSVMLIVGTISAIVGTVILWITA